MAILGFGHVLLGVLLLGLTGVIQARPPGLYYPPPGEEFHATQIRSHLDDNTLSPLSENELETLLFLLDKVQRPPPAHRAPMNVFGDRRNKRTGAHHLTNIASPAAAKRASRPTDWSDYFGIDKREVKALSPAEILEVTGKEPAPKADEPKAEQAKADTDRQEMLRQFYNNMAMSATVKRKREIRSGADLGTRVGKEMEKIGDELIWDALKLTGSHRDAKMSKKELENLKKQLIQRIGAAYSLEKLRQVLEGGHNNNPSLTNAIGQ